MESLLRAVRACHWVSVRSVSAERRDLHLRLELWSQPSERPTELWTISCFGVREFSLSDFDGGGLNWWDRDHPLLLQFTSPKASLRVALSGSTIEMITGILASAHRAIVDDWIPFERFARASLFRSEVNPATIAGPEFLLAGYAARLADAQVAATLKRHKRKLYWYGRGWSERRYDVSLLHFGESFVAAERFAAHAEATIHMRSNRRLQPSADGAIVPPRLKRRR